MKGWKAEEEVKGRKDVRRLDLYVHHVGLSSLILNKSKELERALVFVVSHSFSGIQHS